MADTPDSRPMRERYQHKSWTRDDYTISTDTSLVPLDRLDEAFHSGDLYWAKPLPRNIMLETLRNSLFFGLYQAGDAGSTTTMRGFARGITDFTTFLYLTDVYVWPDQQGKGLGKWLAQCVQEVIAEMPYLRRSLLFTSDWERSVPFYEKIMDMTVMQTGTKAQGAAVLQHKGPGMPSSL